ncbi:hypothetical protein [Ascidiaceihabitans sp.]|uniref:hypothetical protein n=1 Tax=Ascidiaceihabitans sp. TaxID=1872644 RepID=UPI0032980C0D
MTTRPFNLKALTQHAARWNGAPQGTVIGHVHLRVGDVVAAAKFICTEIGMV